MQCETVSIDAVEGSYGKEDVWLGVVGLVDGIVRRVVFKGRVCGRSLRGIFQKGGNVEKAFDVSQRNYLRRLYCSF